MNLVSNILISSTRLRSADTKMFIVKKFVSEQMNKRVKDPENKMSPLQFIKVISGILGVSDFINK